VIKIKTVAIRAIVSILPIKAKPHIMIKINIRAANGVLRFRETYDNSFRAFVSFDMLSKTRELPNIFDKMVLAVANKAITEIMTTPVFPFFLPSRGLVKKA